MADNEIMKAWKWHISPVHCNGREIYSAVVECSRELAENTLSLINRQKAEIKKLEKELMKCKLEKEMLCNVSVEKQNIAIKEFAERLKDEMRLEDDCRYDCMNCLYECKGYVLIIDNLVKEMTEVETNQRKEDEGK